MNWIETDRSGNIPKNRLLLCYCPQWSNSGYQVAKFNGDEFYYDEDLNGMFDEYVLQWAIFLEAD